MKALTFQGKERVGYTTVPDPQLNGGNDVIVKVKACAICGSDLHVYHEREKGMDHGAAMGHEFVGEIVDVGSDVRSLRKGDMVMSPFTTSCGKCFYCLNHLPCRCIHGQLFGWVEKGRGLQGGQAEFVRVPMAESTLMHIPDGISMDEALLMGDVLSTGFFCARQAEVSRGSICVVVGCGPVGLMAVLGALELHAEKVFAVDVVPERLSMVMKLGASPVHLKHGNIREELNAVTEGRGADCVMEASGNATAVKLAVSLVRPGGIVSSVGVCTDEHLAFSPVEAYNKNLTYRIGRCPARFMMDELVSLVQRKKYDITSVFTHRMNLADGKHGYEVFAEKKDNCLKVLLAP